MKIKEYNTFDRLSTEVEDVLTLSDLKVLLSRKSCASFYRVLSELVDAGELIKIKRSVYARPTADLNQVLARVAPDAYISAETVLAEQGIVGSISARKVQAVWTKKAKVFQSSLGRIELLHVDPKFYFGFDENKRPLRAKPEKAFLDVCYFYFKGRRFLFNPESDVNFEDLDIGIIKDWLSQYDVRFQSYFIRIWMEKWPKK